MPLFATAMLCLAGALCAPPGEGSPTSGKPKAAAPNASKQSEVSRLVGRFAAASKDLQEREKIVDEAIALGSPAVTAIQTVIQKELQPQLKRYGKTFLQRAAPVAQKKLSQANLAEAVKLRETVLGLQKSSEFTKELIIAKGDPAMKRLAEIFIIDRQAILDESKSLQEDRKRLFDLGQLSEKCAVFQHNQLPADADKPKEPPSFEKYLQGEEELAAGLATPMDPGARAILAANSRLATQIDPEEAKTILALNLTRNLLGLSALAIDLKLCAAARDHSADMEKEKFFAHESPVPGKKTPWDRAARFGASASAENIFMGVADGKAANEGWFHSPGHHTNMLGNHKRVGVGRSGTYFTELFGN